MNQKIKVFAGQLVLIFAGSILAIYAYEQINKPKVLAPATEPAGAGNSTTAS